MSNEIDKSVFNTVIAKAAEINNNVNISDNKKKEELIKYTRTLFIKKGIKEVK